MSILRRIIDHSISIVQRVWFPYAASLTVFLALSGKFFWYYFQNFAIGGWDGNNHYAIAYYYAQHIFPNLVGWVPSWNAGMPWPLGYPPIVYILLALFNSVVPTSFIFLFRAFFVASTIGIIVMMIALARRLGYRAGGMLAVGLLTVWYMVSKSPEGITLTATFQNGLYPQVWGGLVLLIWLYFYLGLRQRRRDWFCATASLALLVLSNVHMAEAGLFLAVAIGLLDAAHNRQLRVLLPYITHGLTAAAISAWWWLPVLLVNDYFPTRTFEPIAFRDILPHSTVLLLGCFGALVAWQQRTKVLWQTGFAALILLGILLAPIYLVFPGLPIQQWRMFPVVYLLLLLLIPSVYAALFPRKKILTVAVVLTCIPLGYTTRVVDPYLNLPFFLAEDRQAITGLQQYTDGRSMIEVYAAIGYPAHYNIAALSGISGAHQTLWNVFRESSINTFFVQPLRNTFSIRHEDYGVECFLCGGQAGSFYAQPITKDIARAEVYNARYLLNRWSADKANTSTVPLSFASSVAEYGNWELHRLDYPVDSITHGFATSTGREPLLVFTHIDSKHRQYEGNDAYGWIRINEAWFSIAQTNRRFVRANQQLIDETDDLKYFRAAVLIDPQYRSAQRAYERIKEYAQQNYVFWLASEHEALLEKYPDLKREENIIIWYRSGDVEEDVFALLRMAEGLPLDAPPSNIDSFIQGNDLVTITLQPRAERHVIFIAQSYFPWWRVNAGEVFMSSPAFLAIVTDSASVRLIFSPPVYATLLLWLSSICIVCFLAWYLVVWYNKKNN